MADFDITDEMVTTYRLASKMTCGFDSCACDESLRAGLAAVADLLRQRWEADRG